MLMVVCYSCAMKTVLKITKIIDRIQPYLVYVLIAYIMSGLFGQLFYRQQLAEHNQKIVGQQQLDIYNYFKKDFSLGGFSSGVNSCYNQDESPLNYKKSTQKSCELSAVYPIWSKDNGTGSKYDLSYARDLGAFIDAKRQSGWVVGIQPMVMNGYGKTVPAKNEITDITKARNNYSYVKYGFGHTKCEIKIYGDFEHENVPATIGPGCTWSNGNIIETIAVLITAAALAFAATKFLHLKSIISTYFVAILLLLTGLVFTVLY